MSGMSNLKQDVMEFFGSQKGKTKFMLNDIKKRLTADVNKKDLKKATSELIEEGKLEYWTNGSTTYFTLPQSVSEAG